MTPAQLTQLWGQVARTGMPGSRVIFRTAASASPLPGAVPDSILGRFRYKEKESAAFFRQDRSAIYGGFHLYVLEN
jgi:S-adenosylmethionine-diacylglycerol 3-amino-3-carboxypropyl transferase